MRYSFLLAIIATVLLLAGCRPEEEREDPEVISYAYYPVAVGNEYYYQVDSIDYLKIPFDTVSYYQRERYTGMEEFLGDSFFTIEISTRDLEEEKWEVKGYDRTRLLQHNAERKEGNVTFINLKFPVKQNSTWHGAPYNLLDSHFNARADFSKFRYRALHKPYSFKQFSTDSSIQVVQYEDSNLIEQRYFIETYARNVGLVKKLVRSTIKQQDPTNPASPFEIDEGFKYLKRLYDYKIATK